MTAGEFILGLTDVAPTEFKNPMIETMKTAKDVWGQFVDKKSSDDLPGDLSREEISDFFKAVHALQSHSDEMASEINLLLSDDQEINFAENVIQKKFPTLGEMVTSEYFRNVIPENVRNVITNALSSGFPHIKKDTRLGFGPIQNICTEENGSDNDVYQFLVKYWKRVEIENRAILETATAQKMHNRFYLALTHANAMTLDSDGVDDKLELLRNNPRQFADEVNSFFPIGFVSDEEIEEVVLEGAEYYAAFSRMILSKDKHPVLKAIGVPSDINITAMLANDAREKPIFECYIMDAALESGYLLKSPNAAAVHFFLDNLANETNTNVAVIYALNQRDRRDWTKLSARVRDGIECYLESKGIKPNETFLSYLQHLKNVALGKANEYSGSSPRI